MKIEIRNLQRLAALSEETNCFHATIYIDGAKVGTAKNEGHGGNTFVEPRALVDRLNAHGATLPRLPYTFMEGDYPQDAETIIDELVEVELIARELKRTLRTRILFMIDGKEAIYQTKSLKAEVLKRAIIDPVSLGKLGASKVLNTMPFDEALPLYRRLAQSA